MKSFWTSLGGGLGAAIVILALCVADAHYGGSGCSGSHEKPATCVEVCEERGVHFQIHPLICVCEPRVELGAEPAEKDPS